MIEQIYCVVHGRVQGVGFRMFVRDQATELGINGWVRNREDGYSVECVAQGDTDALEQFQRRVRKGPPGAKVEKLLCDRQPAESCHDGFFIRR